MVGRGIPIVRGRTKQENIIWIRGSGRCCKVFTTIDEDYWCLQSHPIKGKGNSQSDPKEWWIWRGECIVAPDEYGNVKVLQNLKPIRTNEVNWTNAPIFWM
jgi:hypothetical protein